VSHFDDCFPLKEKRPSCSASTTPFTCQRYCKWALGKLWLGLLDEKPGYALRKLRALDRIGLCLIVVVSWNSCPEYLEDVWDQGPDALLAGDIVDKQDLRELLDYMSAILSRGERYRSTFGVGTSLTRSERVVLRGIALGLSNRVIGEQAGIKEKTVKNVTTSIYEKLDLHDRVQLALYYWGLGRQSEKMFAQGFVA